ncbi:DUF7344 domain-containing protein [Haladaptatus halobius]|jgi:hypothetical protein|uniref:DUF7344 domain-containing protein n=1 Tax=Haladaptatus halobius TaxID=2884875 RepID=UPI001D0B2945|nr:hypothetical protein [Haladaptatus halobius]
MSTIGDSSGTGSNDTDSQSDGSDSTVAEHVSDLFESKKSQTERAAPLSRDMVFDVLKNQRRRYALHYLKQAEETVQLSDLAEQVAAWENDTTVDAISAAERKRVYTALYQSHLPKLDDAGIVDYNQNRGIVELATAAEQLDPYLETNTGDDISWCKRYLGLAVAGFALLTAAWLEVPLLAGIADIGLALLVVLAFTLVAVFHTYDARRAPTTGETMPEILDE